MKISGKQLVSVERSICFPQKTMRSKCSTKKVVGIAKGIIAMLKAKLVYTKTMQASGVLGALVVAANKHTQEKITQSKVNYVTGSAKNVLLRQKGFRKICLLVTSEGSTTNSGNQQTQEASSGILTTKFLSSASLANVLSVDGISA
jgi:hypothetical protein